MTAGASYAADPGEPDTGFLEGGEKRTLGTLKGKPEPWYDGGGYTQMHFPKADHIYGKGKPADYKAIKQVLMDHTIKLIDLLEAGRIPRKKGQKRKSKQHSDLYTDENPKGTIHGLKFATVKDAEASVRKIKSSGRKHAHKVQAAVAMEQRAKAAGKKSAAAVYRRYINSVKKTEADLHSKLSRGHKPDWYQLHTPEFKPFDKSRDDVEEDLNEVGDLSAGFYKVTGPLFDAGGRRYCTYEFTTESKLRYKVVFYDSVKGLTEMWFETFEGSKQIPMHLTTDRGEAFKVIGTAIGILDHYLTAEGAGAPYGIKDNRTPNQIHNPEAEKIIIKPVKEKKRRGRGYGDDIESDRRREKIYMQFLKKQGFSPRSSGSDILIDIKQYQKKEGIPVEENFADGKKPGRKGISKRVGIPKGASLTQLAKLAKAKGEKGRMARWQLNMRRGKKKKKSS